MPQLAQVLQDPRFYVLLERCDADLAAAVHTGRCPWCGGVLHRAGYQRKPRGGPMEGLPAGYDRRFSFCCAEEGCRRRATPPSVRFLGRRVFLGAVVVLVMALEFGSSPRRLSQLCRLVAVSRRTLTRWRQWWRQTFPATRFWREHLGDFVPPAPTAARLPASLMERSSGEEAARLEWVLRFLRPLTTTWAPVPGC